MVVGNTGVEVRKSEGGTRVEEETQINEGRAWGNKLSLLFARPSVVGLFIHNYKSPSCSTLILSVAAHLLLDDGRLRKALSPME